MLETFEYRNQLHGSKSVLELGAHSGINSLQLMTNRQLIGEAVFNLRVHAFFVFLGVANCQGRRRQRTCLHPPFSLTAITHQARQAKL